MAILFVVLSGLGGEYFGSSVAAQGTTKLTR